MCAKPLNRTSEYRRGLRLLMLLTDGFGGIGGIATFNRAFLGALSGSALISRAYAWPRLIPCPISRPLPEAVVYERRFAVSKWIYIAQVFRDLFLGQPTDVVVCGHINLLPAAWLVAKARRARLALIIHGVEAWKPTTNAITNFLAGRVDGLLSVSRYSASKFLEWSNLPQARCSILPNCIDLELFTPGPKPAELVARYHLEGSKIVMTMGRLDAGERYKGFDEVIDAMARLKPRIPELKYLVVGDGDDRERLVEKAKLCGVGDTVIFAGHIPDDERVGHYRLADVYAMPSSGEGFGIVFLEALACGVPVIGSKTDGSRDALLDGRLGVLVDPGSPGEIDSAMFEMLKRPADRSRPSGIETFSSDNFQKRVHNWLAEFAEEPVARETVKAVADGNPPN